MRPGEDEQDSKDAVVSANSCPGKTDNGCAPITKINEVLDGGRRRLRHCRACAYPQCDSCGTHPSKPLTWREVKQARSDGYWYRAQTKKPLQESTYHTEISLQDPDPEVNIIS